MAEDTNDNVLVKNGNSGGDDYTVSTDYATINGTNGHVQYMKLVDGTNGGTTVIPGSAQGLFVIPRQDVQVITVASGGLTTATTAYSVGDQVGTLFTLSNAARSTGGTGSILGVSLTDAKDIIGSYDVVIFRSSVTLAADNAGFSISATDAKSVVEVVSLNYAIDLGAGRFARLMGLNIPYDCSGGTSLYAALITRSAHTYFTAVTDLQLTVYVARD